MTPKLTWNPMSSVHFSKNTEKNLEKACKINDESDCITLLDHQKIVKTYIHPKTPYRGLLLYHGLGSGKTLSAIAVSEAFKSQRKTVVFLPGQSLEDNFIHELEKCGNKHYVPQRKHWIFKQSSDMNQSEIKQIPKKTLELHDGGWIVLANQQTNFSKLKKSEQKDIKEQIRQSIDEQYRFIRYNGVSKERLENFKTEGLLDNKLVIVDEAHNVISMITNYINDPTNTKQHIRGRLLYDLFMNCKNTRFIFLSGTPIINYPKELSVIFNILKGPVTMFKYNISYPKKTSSEFKEYVRKFPYIDYMKITDNSIEVTQTTFGFAIKDDKIFLDDNSPTNHVEWIKRFKSYISYGKGNIDLNSGVTQELLCLPSDKFDESFIKGNQLDNIEVFSRRIIGLVSYYGDIHKYEIDPEKINDKMVFEKKGFPTMTVHPIEKLQMTNTQYARYQKERLKEIRNDLQKAARKMSRVFEDEGKELTTYRARSLAVCNFAYPLTIEPDEKIHAKNRDKMLQQLQNKFDAYVSTLKHEDLKSSLQELSPKYWKIQERILYSKGTSVVYSHLKNREGLVSMFTIMKRLGWKPLKISFDKKEGKWDIKHGGNKTYILYGDKSDEHREYLRKIFNSEFDGIPTGLADILPFKSNLRGEIVKAFFITASGAEGITLKNVRQLHIVEHHWSEIRVDQVIGRVCRLHSHSALPINEQKVDVYKYATIFGDIELSETLLGDNGKTSDEAVIATAQRKKIIGDHLLKCIRGASIDCVYHKVPGCYQIDNNSYHPNFETHIQDSEVNIAPMIKLVLLKLPSKSWIPNRFHKLEVLYDEITYTVYDKESVKIGRPKEIAMMIKKEKAFMPV
tara:strand:- start:3434 stop:5983 length:2550 start_codon:yes stop_codon:yes gene_type:complete